jgi:tRNA 2-selenouridine synthase
MAIQRLLVGDWLKISSENVVLDVRSPGEYAAGHLPGAISFPLFSDAERAHIGTTYKQMGAQVAFELGLSYVGPKLRDFVVKAHQIAGNKALSVYCWRGGQRSASLAWLLDQAGFQVNVLEGGYKSWRNYIDQLFENPAPFCVLGGHTGSGKTAILQAMEQKGAQIIDLEALAVHKGSSFGAFPGKSQPSTEHFANLLAAALLQKDPSQPIWLEDEGPMIGTVHLPTVFFHQLRHAPLLVINIDPNERIQRLVADYGQADRDKLAEAFVRIRKKIGGQHLQTALHALSENDLETAAKIALRYYDKAYDFDLQLKNCAAQKQFSFSGKSTEEVADSILLYLQQHPTHTWTTKN